jgi:hypothetical protein
MVCRPRTKHGVEVGALSSCSARIPGPLIITAPSWSSALRWLVAVLVLIGAPTSKAAEHHVGPGQALTEIDQVPWESLEPGDTVSIHWRPQPYRSKWVICRAGTAEKPITVRGVANEKGAPPVIDGNGATTVPRLDYWHEQRSVIKIGGANVPADIFPAHIVIEGLEVRGARPPFTYKGRAGEGKYVEFAAGIFVEKGGHITIRDCVLTDNANGLLVASQSKEVTVERCWIHGNGVEGSVYAHNAYTSAAGMNFQFNRFGPLRDGCPGNNLKDRSAGLVVRCNWIEGGSRQLDLVDAEDRESLRQDARYHEAIVFGNILIERDGDGSDQVVHFGGDSGKEQWYRRGPMRFHHNTVVSMRRGGTSLLRLPTADQRVDARNNIVFTPSGGRLEVASPSGVVELGVNWLPRGWGKGGGTVFNRGVVMSGTSPGFVRFAGKDFQLAPGSVCIGAGETLGADQLPPGLREAQYHPHRSSTSRDDLGEDGRWTLGAFEFKAPEKTP